MSLWASIVVAPLAFLTSLSLGYALVPLACQTQRDWPLHATSALALAMAFAGIALAWRTYRESTPAPHTARAKDDAPHARFLATVGVFVSALFALATLALWSTVWVLSPCFA
jgi:H+/Cl- antiporter ClcA